MDDVLGVADVADRYGVNPRTVRRWCAEGRLPGAKLKGRVWLIPADALKEFKQPKPGPEPRRKD